MSETGETTSDHVAGIESFSTSMKELSDRLAAAADVWDVSADSSGLLADDAWATAEQNLRRSRALTTTARAKTSMRLLDTGSELSALADEIRTAARAAVEALEQDANPLDAQRERIHAQMNAALARLDAIVEHAKERGEASDTDKREYRHHEETLTHLKQQASALETAENLFRGSAAALGLLAKLQENIREVDRTSAARRRQRRRARASHPAFQFTVLLLLGVVAVNVMADRVAQIGPMWAWAFAIASFVLIDYVVEPWIERRLRRRAVILLQRELDASQVVVESIPLLIATVMGTTSTAPGMQDLQRQVVALGQAFLPRANTFLTQVAGNDHQEPGA